MLPKCSDVIMLKLTIKGDPTTKKNHSQIIVKNGKRCLIPSKQYKDYEEEFLYQCMEQRAWNKNISTPVNIKCMYYMKTRRKVDLANLLNGTDDALVNAGVIEDDNCKIVVGHDGSRVCYDKNNPRVEIEIEEIEGSFK